MIDASLCLCGSGMEYSDCCSPYHTGSTQPSTAEVLMRSRFTAYAMRNAEYLLETWQSDNRPSKLDFSKETAEWQKLEIIVVKKGQNHDEKGIVEFKAHYLQGAERFVMHEVSRFVKKQGRWLYLDGVVKSISPVSQQTNQGRNALCQCGSGKKFKRCCAALER